MDTMIGQQLTPPDESTGLFLCENCLDEFELVGEVVYTNYDGMDFTPSDGVTLQCPNDNGDNEHDISLMGSVG